MEEGRGVPGGAVEQNFGSPSDVGSTHPAWRTWYRVPIPNPAPTRRTQPLFLCTLDRLPRRSRGCHRISVPPPLLQKPKARIAIVGAEKNA